jgi:RNA polymerase sigma-70 factor (ECF subfamily)
MVSASPEEVTELLRSWSDGDESALERLVPLVYAELRRLARGYLRGEHAGQTLQTTALINEAFLRLIQWKGVSWQNRAHFYGVSARIMRRILVSISRAHRSEKRGKGIPQVILDEEMIPGGPGSDVVAVDEALQSLEALDARKARVVELRFFGGLTTEEAAEVLGVSTRTVEREMSLAQAWLLRELGGRIGGQATQPRNSP